MSSSSKTPDLKAISTQFMGKEIDWVDDDSDFKDRTYLEAVGPVPLADGSSVALADTMVEAVGQHYYQPRASRLATELMSADP